MAKARKEVAKTAAKHSQEKSTGLVDQLSSLPLEAWENEFPFLDMCLKETIRLHLHGALLRRNISETDIKIGEEIIPAGAFVVCF
jgi:cytochrome P450